MGESPSPAWRRTTRAGTGEYDIPKHGISRVVSRERLLQDGGQGGRIAHYALFMCKVHGS